MKSAKKDGTAVINGIDTTVYKWGDNLGPIPMNELYLYVNEETKGPVRMIRDVHPFGKEVGNITIDFQNFKQVQSIPASVWDLGVTKETVIVQSSPTVDPAIFKNGKEYLH